MTDSEVFIAADALNLLQYIILIDVSKDNLASRRYITGKNKIIK